VKNGIQHIYLDYSATTPLDPEVSVVITAHLKDTFGNASSVHAYGRKAKVLLEESREVIAKSIAAHPSEIFFTSGGTEADNHALIGAAFAQKRDFGKDHIIVSAVEHHAVLDTVEYLQQHGFAISYIPVDSNGRIIVEKLEALIRTGTGIISVMHANNEVGTLQPIIEVAEVARQHGVILHSDTVQTYGKIPIDVREMQVDMLSLSSHKIYGPKGAGAIYIRKGVNIDALFHGGAQERNNRAGTENVPFIAGFAKAVELSQQQISSAHSHAAALRNALKEKICAGQEGVVINGDEKNCLPHILSVSLDSEIYDVEGESLLLNMDLQGVAVSSGSACTSGSVQPSHVLLAMGCDKKTAKSTIRFSYGKLTALSEIEKAAEIFCSIVQSLPKKVSSVH